MFVHICMLTQVYELLITQLHIFSINFINVLSKIPLYTLLSVSCVISEYQYGIYDYMCITSVIEDCQSIRLLLK